MSSLTNDLVVEILSRIPVKSLLICRCVCKSWCVLISDPNFAKLHFNRAIEREDFNLLFVGVSTDVVRSEAGPSSPSAWIRCSSGNVGVDTKIYAKDWNSHDEAMEINYPVKDRLRPLLDGAFSSSIMILGSCNGLICFSTDNVAYIWNPSTEEHQLLPIIPGDYNGFGSAHGFGYDPISESFKLLRVQYFSVFDLCDNVVNVYSSVKNSWSLLPRITYNISKYIKSGVFYNGALHWIGETKFSTIISIVSFDLVDEVFRELPKPDDVYEDAILGVSRNCLCLLNESHRTGDIEMYVMKEYGVMESWTKLFSIVQGMISRSFHELRLLGFLNNGEILLERDNVPVGFRIYGEFLWNSCKDLLLYDPKQDIVRKVEIPNIPNHVLIQQIETYVGTLFSLKSGINLQSSGTGVRTSKQKTQAF